MKRFAFIISLMALMTINLGAQSKKAKVQQKTQTYDVAAYLYPAYAAGEPRLKPFWPMDRENGKLS